jgi:hypothetical protein
MKKRVQVMTALNGSFFCLVLLSGHGVFAQKKFNVEKGEISFTSNATLELIKASSSQIRGVIDPGNNQFAFIVRIKSFEGFNSSLQKEHFNEKYLESDKYYDATFTGKIVEPVDLTKDGEHVVQAKGTMVIHGKRQARTIPSKVVIKNGKLNIGSDFSVLLADHDIKVPTIVSAKIATEIYIHLDLTMIQK